MASNVPTLAVEGLVKNDREYAGLAVSNNGRKRLEADRSDPRGSRSARATQAGILAAAAATTAAGCDEQHGELFRRPEHGARHGRHLVRFRKRDGNGHRGRGEYLLQALGRHDGDCLGKCTPNRNLRS
jgi:hypothetical protein